MNVISTREKFRKAESEIDFPLLINRVFSTTNFKYTSAVNVAPAWHVVVFQLKLCNNLLKKMSGIFLHVDVSQTVRHDYGPKVFRIKNLSDRLWQFNFSVIQE